MKQLLKNCGDFLIVGFSDRAYLACASPSVNKIFELKPSPALVASQKVGKKDDAKEDDKQQDGDEDPPKENNAPCRDVQSVAITSNELDPFSVWCAVSRSDKSLDVYSVNVASSATSDTTGDSTEPVEVQPVTCHVTKKRVGFLCFGSLPAGNSQVNKSEMEDLQNNLVVLAGDLAGDVYAYSPKVAMRQRLLLGHTASMITGVCVSGSQILTADRDEKIRVSQFPDSHVIDGFLLGHTAYVSAMDVVPDDASAPMRLVSTCDGDGSLRLWNIDTLQQVAEVELNQEEGDGAKDKESPSAFPVPTDVAIDPHGSRVAVVYDKSQKVDIYQISIVGDEEKVVNMSLERSFEWPSQPLSISFQGKDTLIGVLRDPEYCIAYHVNGAGHDGATKVMDALRQVARAKKYVMPETILEKDPFGNIKLQKLEETRGPAGADAPWNRVERIAIHKKRNRRAKKRRHDR